MEKIKKIENLRILIAQKGVCANMGKRNIIHVFCADCLLFVCGRSSSTNKEDADIVEKAKRCLAEQEEGYGN